MTSLLEAAWTLSLLLQYDSEYDDPWKEGNVWEGFTLPFTELLGPVAPAILGIGIASILYILTEGRPGLPAVVSILIGGFLMPFLPPTAKVGAFMSILFGATLALYALWNGGGARPR
ncbi:hypothetical protein [Halolamina salifodinae]|uniref:Uncharacterized protein n=1 Tax=Halolamina salifodinae TaxID=1202767 RepID=A0A8T4GW78_9EURY|nr:hypothetical protein [Halolamina salifodinae]MBP1987247.1 hypothetical protein [Halolamina salifodinae]